jgi:hypothetical protein
MTSNHESRKLNRVDFLNFILGGNAHVTFKNVNTGNRFTYRIRKSKNSQVYFVGVLCGSDNENAYSYIGVISDNKTFRWTKASKIKADAPSVLVFNYVFSHILADNLPQIIEIWHEGRCGRCGRLLTDPDSIASGFGPICVSL